MAVKWAVANGNWNAGATWNDGTIPQVDDDVYANNHAVTINVATVVVGSLNTMANADYGIAQGGSFSCSVPTSISASRTCDLRFSMGNVCINYNANTNANCYFSAPLIRCNANGMINHTYGNNTGWVINANVEISNTNCHLGYGGAGNTRHILTINGNITSTNGFIFSMFSSSTTAGWTIIINGNVYGGHESAENQGLGYVTINGNKHYCLNEYDNFEKGGLTINGSVTYEANNSKAGIDLNHTTIQNPDTFIWKDVTEPRSNPFVILTNAEMNNRQQYPAESDVRKDVEYAWGVLKGQLEQVQVGCVTKEDVREGVALLGMGEVGTLVVPDADDVREGVVFDNGSVGTLIVEGGGDRLRIANFGYYTDSQSDTYIVDINDSFKPMFATAEESVLLELFPELDLDNIPDKYFDDLFVKYLKYRLIVEYYRGAGINSVFTPSELTTEVVNYQNVRCEYWLNLANIYLNAWDKKYPNSVKKQRILL